MKRFATICLITLTFLFCSVISYCQNEKQSNYDFVKSRIAEMIKNSQRGNLFFHLRNYWMDITHCWRQETTERNCQDFEGTEEKMSAKAKFGMRLLWSQNQKGRKNWRWDFILDRMQGFVHCVFILFSYNFFWIKPIKRREREITYPWRCRGRPCKKRPRRCLTFIAYKGTTKIDISEVVCIITL